MTFSPHSARGWVKLTQGDVRWWRVTITEGACGRRYGPRSAQGSPGDRCRNLSAPESSRHSARPRGARTASDTDPHRAPPAANGIAMAPLIPPYQRGKQHDKNQHEQHATIH